MNLIALIAHLPTSTWIGFVVSVVLPGLSAAVVKAHWDAAITGIVTLALSTATGFFTEWAHAGAGFHWQYGAALALASWIIAALTQSKILAGTGLEAWLLALGSRINISDPYLDGDDSLTEPSDPTLTLDDTGSSDTTAVPADPEQPAAGVPPAAAPMLPTPDPAPVAVAAPAAPVAPTVPATPES